jgi:hypothetical protein
MSSLAWIDFDEAERQRAQRIMALFQERESRDELGLGSIRDSIADHLFPGTSTIQTRLRYMLFIPWIFQKLESSEKRADQLAIEARALENDLAKALMAGGEFIGVIGREKGIDLQRLPSSVYWAGLGAWGIRLFPGSTDSLFSSMRQLGQSRTRIREGEHSAAFEQQQRIWSDSLPLAPQRFLECVDFHLSSEEAQFIIDRLVSKHPKALLTSLARDANGAADCNHVWEHPSLADFPDAARQIVFHAQIFSSVMHGAALLYNLLLSQLRENPEWVASYEEQLQEWRSQLDLPAIRAWSLDAFWHAIEHPSHSVRPAAKRFVTEWLGMVCADTISGARDTPAAHLVQQREQRLKAVQSRFSNRAVRDRWGGASGASRLSFRWNQAKAHLRDLANAQ